MMLLLRWVVSALAFLLLPYIISGISVESFTTALILALFWGLLNITLKPILIVLTLPFNVLTFGIFTFVINGFLLWLLGGVIQGFMVSGFWAAFLGALVLSLISSVAHFAFSKTIE